MEQTRGFGSDNEQHLPGPGALGKKRLQDPSQARRRTRVPGGGKQAVPGVAWLGSVAQWGKVWAPGVRPPSGWNISGSGRLLTLDQLSLLCTMEMASHSLQGDCGEDHTEARIQC